MDPFLDLHTEKIAIVTAKGQSTNGRSWARGFVATQGCRAECWLNELETGDAARLERGEKYEVVYVADARPKSTGDCKYRAYVKPAFPETPQEASSNSRYRLSKKSQHFVKKYAEMHGLKTSGHWLVKATDHLIGAIEDFNVFPDLN